MKMLGGDDAIKQCRTVDIMADAAYVVLTRDSRSYTGQFLIDEDVLKDVGVNDFEKYSCIPGNKYNSFSNTNHSKFKILSIFINFRTSFGRMTI